MSVVFKNYIFCSMKPKFLLEIDLSGIINCNTFSVVPSIIDKNAKKRAVPLKEIICQIAIVCSIGKY